MPANSFKQKIQNGFTIIEIVVVIGILAIIFAVVLLAINPVRQFNATTDTRRKADLDQIRKSLMQYYVEYQSFPTALQWYDFSRAPQGLYPTPFQKYFSSLPVDPDPNQRYYYHPLKADCSPCQNQEDTCSAFRLLSRLKNEEDGAIKSVGCFGPNACGVTEWDAVVPNYGVASGCSVKQ